MSKRVLITGAGGFVGGFIVEESLKRGFETWAAVRRSTSREFLQDDRINFIELFAVFKKIMPKFESNSF
jgi:nucleoside-diphosphate-sugar epimerase